eukprot:GGOE01033278.1.p5 GENE.GGOE01033278.1~~GGOE01033278.1.p5  ORF type:complete len:103 (-),score=4.75 GGOE01033278.1:13-321(-)
MHLPLHASEQEVSSIFLLKTVLTKLAAHHRTWVTCLCRRCLKQVQKGPSVVNSPEAHESRTTVSTARCGALCDVGRATWDHSITWNTWVGQNEQQFISREQR